MLLYDASRQEQAEARAARSPSVMRKGHEGKLRDYDTLLAHGNIMNLPVMEINSRSPNAPQSEVLG